MCIADFKLSCQFRNDATALRAAGSDVLPCHAITPLLTPLDTVDITHPFSASDLLLTHSPFEGAVSDEDLLRRKNFRVCGSSSSASVAPTCARNPFDSPPPKAAVNSVNSVNGDYIQNLILLPPSSSSSSPTSSDCVVHQASTLLIAKTPVWYEEDARSEIQSEREKLILGGGGRNLFNLVVKEEEEEEEEEEEKERHEGKEEGEEGEDSNKEEDIIEVSPGE
jgi:hypothetical protein